MTTDSDLIAAYFNTSRLYTNHGQEIMATYDPDTLELRFDDYSRMISGRFANVSCGPDSRLKRFRTEPERFARWVMAHYDRGGYEYAPTRARPVQEPLTFRI